MSQDTQSDTRQGRWSPVLRWVERVVLVGVLVFAAYRLGPQLGAWVGVGPDLGQAPAYELTTLDGVTIASEELRGRVVVLNFWATWCPPCVREMPSSGTLMRIRSVLLTKAVPLAPLLAFILRIHSPKLN